MSLYTKQYPYISSKASDIYKKKGMQMLNLTNFSNFNFKKILGFGFGKACLKLLSWPSPGHWCCSYSNVQGGQTVNGATLNTTGPMPSKDLEKQK